MADRLTQEQFIAKARKVHGDKYDYSKVVYKNAKTKVIITCPEHGEYEQYPPDHTNNRSGCYYCGLELLKKKQRLTQDDFIKRSIKVHGNYYDYSQVSYVNSKTEVKIICPEHGEFYQKPENHWMGKGCIQCGFVKTGDGLRSNTDDFIKKAIKVHGDRYIYDKVEYKSNRDKVEVICPEHGTFPISPSNHLKGKGCPPCGLLVTAETSKRHMKGKVPPNKISLDSFIKRGKKVHNNKYSYDNTVLVEIRSNVKINCPDHGEFEQNAGAHLSGSGCPKCNQSKGEREVNILLDKWRIKYEIQANLLENYKFDFYLPDFNMVIEYHGIQHYEPLEFFGGEKGLKSNQNRDAIKKAYCKGKGIHYYEIPHYVEDIEDYLEKELLKIQKLKDSKPKIEKQDQQLGMDF